MKFFFRPSKSAQITNLETRIEQLEDIAAFHQEVFNSIAEYVASDISAPWMTSAKKLVNLIRCASVRYKV